MKAQRNARRFWPIVIFAAGLATLVMQIFAPAQAAPAAPQAASAALVIELKIDEMVHPMMLEYVNGAFDDAMERKAALILIHMDTPGGLDSSMRAIIHRILISPVPVAVYVSPSGARGASAGFYILMSADIAAMAPGTHAGAASPVLVSMISGSTVTLDETMRKKLINDAAAYLRSITSKRNRNVEIAETAVTEARAFTEKESLKQNLIDVIAASPEDLLAQLNGREITRFNGDKLVLDLKQPVRQAIEPTARQRFLGQILHPNTFFLLLIMGVLGLYVEFSHPGMIVPGVVGGICLILALYAMQVLPVNVVGVLLIGLAVALFILEAKYTSHGLLGLGGAVAMVLGALMLVRSPLTGTGVSLGVALIVTAPFALISVFLMRLVLRSFGWKAATGSEQMTGMTGEVTEAVEPGGAGQIFVNGELWRAVAAAPIPRGARVRVARVDGLTLYVEEVRAPVETSAAI